MFPIVFGSFLLSLGFGAVAFEFQQIQGLMLVGACLAATAFCGSFEAWSSEDGPQNSPRRFQAGAVDGPPD